MAVERSMPGRRRRDARRCGDRSVSSDGESHDV